MPPKPWGAFFVTFFTDKESKGGNPCGFQERYSYFLNFKIELFINFLSFSTIYIWIKWLIMRIIKSFKVVGL